MLCLWMHTKNVLSEAIDLFKKENIPDVIIGLVIKGSEHFNFDGIYNSENENIHVKELNMEEDHYKLVSQILSNDNYYYKSYNFSKDVYNALKNIDLGHTTITDEESGKTINVITSNLQYGEGGNLAYYNDNGKVTYIGDAGNVIKTETYHTKYT